MRIEPIGDRVLVQPRRQERTTSGLYLPTPDERGKGEGVILAIGPKVKEDIKAGDRIIWEEYADIQLTPDLSIVATKSILMVM